MLALKVVLLCGGFGLLAAALGSVVYGLWQGFRRRDPAAHDLDLRAYVRWQQAARLTAVATLLFLINESLVIVPSGMAGVRVSQLSGTRPGTRIRACI